MTILRCPSKGCRLFASEESWEKAEIECEFCYLHEALGCPHCWEVFDLVYTEIEALEI